MSFPFQVTVFNGQRRAVEAEFRNVDQLAAALRSWQSDGFTTRTNFEATVALLQAGEFGISWREARDEAIEDYFAEYGDELEGHGFGSSDGNHVTVGRYATRPLPEAVTA